MAREYGGRWRTIQSVTQGGQAHIFQVEDLKGEQAGPLALKRLINPERLDRFRREIRAAQALRHPHIVPVIDVGAEGGQAFYVMPFYRNGSLRGAGAHSWDPLDKLLAFEQVVDAVATAHRAGIVHRDLKPDNVLVDDARRIIVSDFGICFMEDGQQITMTEIVGPRFYTAPEVEAGEEATPRSDVYALGKILYWLFSGGRDLAREEHQADRASLERLAPLPLIRSVADLVSQTVVADPHGRLADGDALLSSVRAVIAVWRGDFNYPSPTGEQPCRYCGLGKYLVLQEADGGLSSNNAIVNTYGTSALQQVRLRVLECDRCGNVQFFRPAAIKKGNPWIPRAQQR